MQNTTEIDSLLPMRILEGAKDTDPTQVLEAKTEHSTEYPQLTAGTTTSTNELFPKSTEELFTSSTSPELTQILIPGDESTALSLETVDIWENETTVAVGLLEAGLEDISTKQDAELKNNSFLSNHPKIAGVAQHVIPVVTSVGVRAAVKNAHIVAGPLAGGLAGGAAKFATSLYETGQNPAKLYERYIKKQEERSGVWGRVKAISEFAERRTIESAYGVKERDEHIDKQLEALGITVELNDVEQAHINTPDGKNLAEVLAAKIAGEESKEVADALLRNLAIQGKLANFSSGNNESFSGARRHIFETLQSVMEKGDPAGVYASLAAAEAEFGMRERLALSGKLAGIEAVKSTFKAAAGVALWESLSEMEFVKDTVAELAENAVGLKEAAIEKMALLSEQFKNFQEQLSGYANAAALRASVENQLQTATNQVGRLGELQSTKETFKNDIAMINKQIEDLESTLGAQETATSLEALEFDTVDVEIPSGSTVGEGIYTQLNEQGVNLNIWNTESADVWGAMIFENEETDFFKDAYEMAQSVNDDAWMQTATELGFNPDTGTFDTKAVMRLVEQANSGDQASVQKLYKMFHWVRAGDSIKVPSNIQSVLENALSQDVITTIAGEANTSSEVLAQIEELNQQKEFLETSLQNAEAGITNLQNSLVEDYGSTDPIGELINRLEEATDDLNGYQGPFEEVAESIEDLMDEIEDAYEEMGGIHALYGYVDEFSLEDAANQALRPAGIANAEGDFDPNLQLLGWRVGVPAAALLAGIRFNRAYRNRRGTNQTASAQSQTANTRASAGNRQGSGTQYRTQQSQNTGPSQQRTRARRTRRSQDTQAGANGNTPPPGTQTNNGTGRRSRRRRGTPGQSNPTPPPDGSNTAEKPNSQQQAGTEQETQDTSIPNVFAGLSAGRTQEAASNPNGTGETQEQTATAEGAAPPNVEEKQADAAEQSAKEKEIAAKRERDGQITEAMNEALTEVNRIRETGAVPFFKQVGYDERIIQTTGLPDKVVKIPVYEVIKPGETLTENILRDLEREIREKLAQSNPDYSDEDVETILHSPKTYKSLYKRLVKVISPDNNVNINDRTRLKSEVAFRTSLLQSLNLSYKNWDPSRRRPHSFYGEI